MGVIFYEFIRRYYDGKGSGRTVGSCAHHHSTGLLRLQEVATEIYDGRSEKIGRYLACHSRGYGTAVWPGAVA